MTEHPVDVHRGELMAYAFRLLGREVDAQDCVQSAYLQLARRGDPPGNPRAWMYTVVRNLALNHLRNDRRPAPPAGVARPDRELEEREEMERALAGLDEEPRSILLLRYTHGMTFEEVAQVVGRPVGTVKVMAGRALSALRERTRKP